MIEWNEYPTIEPPKDETVLITIIVGSGFGDNSGKRKVVTSQYKYNPMKKKYDLGPDGSTALAWAELPKPYTGDVSEMSMKLRDLIK